MTNKFAQNADLWTPESLTALDRSYENMYRLHAHAHAGLIAELGSLRTQMHYDTLLEVACGTGWNIDRLLDVGYDYCGMDLSETAIAVCMMKFPTARFVNSSIERCEFIADESFDVVFCASMLEHLSDFRHALERLIRMAKHELFVVFFEGLKQDGNDEINIYSFDNDQYKMFGAKFCALQAAYGGNYYWNRYTLASIEQAARAAGVEDVTFLDAQSRPYLKSETILHIRR